LVVSANGQALLRGVKARSVRYRPAFKRAIKLEPEIKMQLSRIALLHDESEASAASLFANLPAVGDSCLFSVFVIPDSALWHAALELSPGDLSAGLKCSQQATSSDARKLRDLNQVNPRLPVRFLAKFAVRSRL
jgi:hypothetical protein